jgi:hypothetical protein
MSMTGPSSLSIPMSFEHRLSHTSKPSHIPQCALSRHFPGGSSNNTNQELGQFIQHDNVIKQNLNK